MLARKMMLILLVGFITTNVYAQDEKERTIQKIVEALEYPRQFKSQIEQANNYAKAQAQQLYQRMQMESGGQLNTKAEEVFKKYLSQEPMQYNDELISTWSSLFGKDLTQEDLNKILAFHQSPVGRKFVLASEKANNEFAIWFLEQQRVKSESSLNDFIKELRAAMQ